MSRFGDMIMNHPRLNLPPDSTASRAVFLGYQGDGGPVGSGSDDIHHSRRVVCSLTTPDTCDISHFTCSSLKHYLRQSRCLWCPLCFQWVDHTTPNRIRQHDLSRIILTNINSITAVFYNPLCVDKINILIINTNSICLKCRLSAII